MVERTGWGKERRPVEQVQMGCLTQTRLAERSRGSPGVAGTSVGVVVVVVAAVVVAGGIIAVVVVGVTIPLAVGRAEAGPVVVPVTLAVDSTIQPVVEPIAPGRPLVGPVVATG